MLQSGEVDAEADALTSELISGSLGTDPASSLTSTAQLVNGDDTMQPAGHRSPVLPMCACTRPSSGMQGRGGAGSMLAPGQPGQQKQLPWHNRGHLCAELASIRALELHRLPVWQPVCSPSPPGLQGEEAQALPPVKAPEVAHRLPVWLHVLAPTPPSGMQGRGGGTSVEACCPWAAWAAEQLICPLTIICTSATISPPTKAPEAPTHTSLWHAGERRCRL